MKIFNQKIVKGYYSFVACTKRLKKDNPVDHELARRLYEFGLKNIKNQKPDVKELLNQVEKQDIVHVHDTGWAQKGSFKEAFATWIHEKGFDVTDPKVNENIAISHGVFSVQNDAPQEDYAVFFFFDMGR